VNPVRVEARRKGAYGVDAPSLLPIPAVLILINLVDGIASRTIVPFVAAGVIVVAMAWGLYASRRGKFVVWARLLNDLPWRGDERVLDVGCGRGAVLLMAAERLPSGRAVGIDLWKKGDQSGNAAEATRRNAEAEGVAGRVELETASMTALPLADASFDCVLSSLAVHNVKSSGRDRALDEAVRVLRPGGRLMIADIMGTRQYRAHLARLGMIDVGRRGLGWRMWWSGPWLPTHLVTATKPATPPLNGTERP
jgi:arsenite methyltransferase